MTAFTLYWRDGESHSVEAASTDFLAAFDYLDFYEVGDTPSYRWDADRREWRKKPCGCGER